MLSPTAGAPNFEGKKEESLPFSWLDLGFAGLAFVCGWIFVKSFSVYFGVGITIFSLSFCLFALCYFRAKKLALSKESFLWLGVFLLSSLSFSAYSGGLLLKFFNFWFLLASGVYWIAVCTKTRIGGRMDGWIVSDILRQIFRVPFGNFGCGFRLAGIGLRRTQKGRGVFGIIGGIAISIPVLGIILPCLISADGTFERMAQNLSANLWRYLGDLFWNIPVALVMGCWLFGLAYGNIYRRKTQEPSAQQLSLRAEKWRFLPVSVMGTMLAVVIFVYVMFFAAQAQSLAQALWHDSPEGGSYCAYARRGFFELCFVSAFNLFLLICSRGLSQRRDGKEHPFLKVLHIFLCAETLLLIASALGKMAMYISRFGLTQLRLYTSWFMVTLAIVFVVLLICAFHRIQTAKILSATVIVSFLLLCWCNCDAWIVGYNISRWESGTLETLDLEDMRVNMPTAAVPQLISLWERTEDPTMKDAIEKALSTGDWSCGEQSFVDTSLQSFFSQRSLSSFRNHAQTEDTNAALRS